MQFYIVLLKQFRLLEAQTLLDLLACQETRHELEVELLWTGLSFHHTGIWFTIILSKW